MTLGKVLILLSTFLFLTGPCLGANGARALLTDRNLELELTHDGRNRFFLLHVPPAFGGLEGPLPLILVLHGGGGTAKGMVKLTQGRFNELADEAGFLVVYPQGIKRRWNEGRDGLSASTPEGQVDDVGFFRALIEHLQAEYKADPARMFVTGISNGGLMSFRLACDLPDKIKAIAPVTASIPRSLETHCSRPAEVGLLLINGTDDPLVPYDGGQITALGRERGEVLSTDETIALWLSKRNCRDQADLASLPDLAPDDGTTVTVVAYPDCNVALYRIEGGGHTWPGGWQYLGEKRIGQTSREIDAAAEIWRFFTQF